MKKLRISKLIVGNTCILREFSEIKSFSIMLKSRASVMEVWM